MNLSSLFENIFKVPLALICIYISVVHYRFFKKSESDIFVTVWLSYCCQNQFKISIKHVALIAPLDCFKRNTLLLITVLLFLVAR